MGSLEKATLSILMFHAIERGVERNENQKYTFLHTLI